MSHPPGSVIHLCCLDQCLQVTFPAFCHVGAKRPPAVILRGLLSLRHPLPFFCHLPSIAAWHISKCATARSVSGEFLSCSHWCFIFMRCRRHACDVEVSNAWHHLSHAPSDCFDEESMRDFWIFSCCSCVDQCNTLQPKSFLNDLCTVVIYLQCPNRVRGPLRWCSKTDPCLKFLFKLYFVALLCEIEAIFCLECILLWPTLICNEPLK